jgi:hypothetical protein
MADMNKVNEATQTLADALREANQAIVESTVAAQERNMRYVQNTFENGIEVLKSQAEDTRNLLQTISDQPQKPQEAIQAVLNTTVAAQERNIRYAQSILQNGADVLKSHVDSTRTLAQTVAEQTRKQQEALQALSHQTIDAYLDWFRAPFAYYQQTWDTAESIAWRGVETAQRITNQGLEAAQKATRQGMAAVQSAAKHGE